MAVEDLKKLIPDSCPKNCSGNGICNSKGHCHCNQGFAPPSCEYPGPGGSTDSGPASDPSREFYSRLILSYLMISDFN